MNHFIMSCAAYIFLFICTLSIAQAKAVDDASGELTPTQQALVKQLSALEGKHAVAGQWEHKALKKFYDTRNGALVWFDKDGEWQRDPEDFERAFQQADMEGLNPDDYRFLALAKQPYTKTNMAALAQRDLQLTNALLHYMRDLSIGRAQPSHVFPKLFLMPEMRDYALTLAAILDEGGDSDIADAFLNLAPKHPDYLALRKALSQYKTLAENKEFWQDIPKGRVIKPGDHDARMPLIRQRMRALGRLDGQNDIFDNLVNMVAEFTADESGEHSDDKEAASDPNPQWKYDAITEEAVRKFQKMSGAKVDGVIGPKTLGELNTPLKDRIRQIELSMERWRWLPESLGDKYVLANIAAYNVKGIEGGEVVFNSPAIVGQVAHQTPAFSSYITDVKFYPDWSVPSSIAQRYVLEKIQNNPAVIQSLGYEIYQGNEKLDWRQVDIAALQASDFPPYRFRQKPGPKNALGMVRFSIDNDYAIYMHDTSDPRLFEEEDRSFSSGCIRVQKREDMAEFLLDRNSKLSGREARQKFAIADGYAMPALKSETYVLDQDIPVHIVYMTAWIGEAGEVHFGQDIYGRDKKLVQALIRQEGSL